MSTRVSLLALVVAPAAVAQDFSYPDFSSIAGLTLNGNAVQAGTALRVSASASYELGSVYHDQPTRVASGFSTTFEFQITQTTNGGADGMTFIVQNSADGLAALGDDGSAMGYAENSSPGSAIENCLVVEFDTWSSGFGDVDDNHVSVHTGGTGDNSFDEAYSLAQVSVPNDMSDGTVHVALIRYAGGILEVYVDDLVTPLISVPWDFATGGTYTGGGAAGGLSLINGESAYVGFTAANGGAWENHDVLSWTWNDADVGQNYCGPANTNSTGAPGVIGATGSEFVASNDLALTASALPPGQFATFVTSQTTGFTAAYGGGQGNLCLGGAMGQHKALVGNTGAAGVYSSAIDLTQVPTPTGFVSVLPGETWNWQCWFRDQNPTRTTNLTDAIAITFQ